MNDIKFRDTNWKELCKHIYPNQAEFKCTPEQLFLESLSDDGYDDWRRIQTQASVAKANKGGKYSGLTSATSTGRIYIEELDCYYIIDIEREDVGVFGIKMWFAPKEFKQKEID